MPNAYTNEIQKRQQQQQQTAHLRAIYRIYSTTPCRNGKRRTKESLLSSPLKSRVATDSYWKQVSSLLQFTVLERNMQQ